MPQIHHGRRSSYPLSRYLGVIGFGIAFALVEAAVVYYLRRLLGISHNYAVGPYKLLLNLGVIAFIKPLHPVLLSQAVSRVEVAREAATLVMLVCVAFIAGSTWRQKVGTFLVAFACWDGFYYLFLKIMTGWPQHFSTLDIYFLIPVTWVGPVITPLIASTLMFLVGTKLTLARPRKTGKGTVA